MERRGELCFSCYDDITFRMHGYTPEIFSSEIRRYVETIHEGKTVECSMCDRKVVFERSEDDKIWHEKTMVRK